MNWILRQGSQSISLPDRAAMLLTSPGFVPVSERGTSVVSAKILVSRRGSDYVPAMTQAAFSQRNSTPRRFNALTKSRFLPGRERLYRARIEGEPTDRQTALIQTLARLEWAALKAEAEGTLVGYREAREHRRLFQRLLDDFEATLPGAPAVKSRLTQHLAARP
jgi:hypothetical protein